MVRYGDQVIVPLRLYRESDRDLKKRFYRLPQYMQQLVREDIRDALANRLAVMESIRDRRSFT